MNKVIQKIKSGFINKDLLFIFGSGCLSQLCGLISSIFVVRGLSKTSYGEYVQANNLYSYVAIWVGMGFTAGILQFCSEPISGEQKNDIYKYTLKKGSLFNISLMLVIGIMAFWQYAKGDLIVAKYLIYMLGYPPILYIYNYIQTVLRVMRKNKEYAYVNILYSISLLLCNVEFTKLFGVDGLILSFYVAYAMAIILGFYFSEKDSLVGRIKHADGKPKNQKDIDRYSLSCTISNFAYEILLLIDVTCIGFLIENEETLADYKVASTIPTACGFASICLMTYYYPQLVDTLYRTREHLPVRVKKVLLVFAGVNLPILVVGVIFSPLILELLYGTKYTNAVPIFRILMFNFYISSTMRRVMGNFIVIIKHVHINFIHSIIAGCLNIILDMMLIKEMGSIGAAIATTICTVFMSGLEVNYVLRKVKTIR